MATLKKIFKADLCPKKPDSKLLLLGDTAVSVEVTLTTKKPAPSSKFDRCVKAAEAKVADYTKIIQTEVTILEGKVKDAQKKGDAKALATLVDGTSVSVQGACRSMQAAVEVAVAAMLKKEAQGDQNLLEAQIVVGVKIAFKTISLAQNVTRLAVTGGADLHAWKGLVMDIKGLGETIYALCQGEESLRKELLMAIGKYCTDKQRRVIEEQKAAASKKAKFVLVAKNLYRAYKPQADKAEAARKAYRNKVTGIRHDVDAFFTKVDKLFVEMKKVPNLKQGVAIGAKVMGMKRAGRGMVDNLDKAQGFADDMAMLLTEAGVAIDDSTFVQRIKSLAALGDVKAAAGEIKTAIGDIQDLIENISQLAG